MRKSKKDRDPLDRYYTPTWATEYLVSYWFRGLMRPVVGRSHAFNQLQNHNALVWEPSCGHDYIGRVLRAQDEVSAYIGSDLDKSAYSGWWYRDPWGAVDQDWPLEPFDFLKDDFLDRFEPLLRFRPSIDPRFPTHIIGNPPYTCDFGTASEFIARALQYRAMWGCSVAMLLRIGWFEPCDDRVEIWRNNPPSEILVLPRVNYHMMEGKQGNGNNQTSAWCIWDEYDRGTAFTVAPKNKLLMGAEMERQYQILTGEE